MAEKDYFITTWETTNNNESIAITTERGVEYNFTVDWGDGTTTNHTYDALHSYEVPGIYTVKISGEFPRIFFYTGNLSKHKLKTIEQWGTTKWISMENAFFDCKNLIINSNDVPDLSLTTTLKRMFVSCESLKGDLSSWDVSNVTNMSGMFEGAKAFTSDLSGWDVSNVTDMSRMFVRAGAFNSDLSSWNVSKVTDMRSMFDVAGAFTSDLSSWDVSQVTDMSRMFAGTGASTFHLSSWDVSKVTDMNHMFVAAPAFTSNLSSWDVSQVTNMYAMFSQATSFNGDVSNWNVSKVINMGSMFSQATSFNGDLSSWDVSKVTDMAHMFLLNKLSIENYDALLMGWSQLALQPNVSFHGGFSNYCAGKDARKILTEKFKWKITDAGEECSILVKIAASPRTLPADGTSTATVTVLLIDTSGNPITDSDATVEIKTTEGSISSTTRQSDGTYQAILTAPFTTEPAILYCLVNGERAEEEARVRFTPAVDIKLSTITASPTRIEANNIAASTITVQLKDVNGNNISLPNAEVLINSSIGTIRDFQEDRGGRYTATLVSGEAGNAEISYTVNSADGAQKATVVCFQVISLRHSIITASPTSILADNTEHSLITVELRDAFGNRIQTGGAAIQLFTSLGTLSNFKDNNDGTYTQELRSGIVGNATVSFFLGETQSSATASVQFVRVVNIDDSTYLQSPHIFLQAAGSTGSDGSTSGIHLRWTFKDKLGEQHLPKGNAASTTLNFNKPDDFVRIYRTPFQPRQTTIDLSNKPVLIDDQSAIWIYQQAQDKFLVRFADQETYQRLRQRINPLTGSPLEFIRAYGSGILEIESRNTLAYSVAIEITDSVPQSQLQTEVLAVEAQTLSATKHLIARKTYQSPEGTELLQMGDNIRSVRCKAISCTLAKIHFGLYKDVIDQANKDRSWTELGSYALTDSDAEAFGRLEPVADTVHGKWPRFNDRSFVNLDNYKDRWNGTSQDLDKNLQQVVQRYIDLSNDGVNPRALENLEYPQTVEDETFVDTYEVSYLDVLFIASMDYHIARMLGLGTLDYDASEASQTYVYAMEYHTQGNLGDGKGRQNVQHLYLSLPTAITDDRLPLPMDLKAPVPGIAKAEVGGINPRLTDEEGYTFDGKKRFLSFFTEELIDYNAQTFYQTTDQFNTSTTTTPVYIGIEQKREGDAAWQQPEISHTVDYFNWSDTPNNRIPETVPILIPEPLHAAYVHLLKEEGVHIYGSYGVNWFGRSQQSTRTHRIETAFRPQNRLLAPSNTQALHIVEERPLLLTSLYEQELYTNNPEADKTLVRLTFDYHSTHEVVNYKIQEEDKEKYPDLLHPDAIFEDAKEVFADHLELCFRNELPKNIVGQVKSIKAHPTDALLSIIETQAYTRHSTGERVVPEIPRGTVAANFTGGIWTSNNEQFVIQAVEQQASGIVITVYNNQSTLESDVEYAAPNTEGSDGFFMAIENMLSLGSWGAKNPHTFQVEVPNWNIHRELIIEEGPNGNIEEIIEKSRGIWDENCKITPVLEPETVNENNEVLTEVHKGVYKIAFSQPLAQHPQFATNANSVEWSGGIVRIHAVQQPAAARRVLKVIRIEHVGTTNNIEVYVQDDTFNIQEDNSYASDNPIHTEGNVSVNFYPGYRVYLYAAQDWGLTAAALRPKEDEEVAYAIFGLRSVATAHTTSDGNTYKSKIGVPGMMFTQKIIEPQRPELPKGALYATRPDSFGKATYTLTTAFKQNPYAILYYRTDEQAILNALYSAATQAAIKQQLKTFGKDAYQSSRWNNLLRFDYTYATNDPVNTNGQLGIYPPTREGYRFPNPDSAALFDSINNDITRFNREFGQRIAPKTPGNLIPSDVILPGGTDGEDTTLSDYMQKAIFDIFTPLTELPMIYAHIKTSGVPVPKKQVIKDRNGYLLSPTDPLYEIAPMAKKDSAKKEVLFTDFTLDGTSNNLYFYSAREMGNTMQLGDFSPVLGPIQLVNTKAPAAPEVKRIIPVLAASNHGMKPVAMTFSDVRNLEVATNQITKITDHGWNAGAASTQILKGNTYITYQVPEKALLMVGYSAYNANDHFESISYGLLCNEKEELIVYENGSAISTVGTYTASSRLKIARSGKKILFYKDDLLLHTITTPAVAPILVDIAMHTKNRTIDEIELYTDNQYFIAETLETSEIPLTITNFDNVAVSGNTITKPNGLAVWDSGGTSNEFLPYYGAISYKVTTATNILVGLANYNEDNAIASIQYAIYAKDDGLLYAYKNGEKVATGVAYDAESLLTIERRNDHIIYKKDHRVFFTFQLPNNIPFIIDFALKDVGSSIRELKMYQTQKRMLDTLIGASNPPSLRIELNAYQEDQNIAKVNLYRTLDPVNSLSIRTMELVQSVDLKISGALQDSVLTVTDDFLDMEYIPYSDPIYYRATVCREVEYTVEEDGQKNVVTAYAPSEPSRVMISSIVETTNPTAPVVSCDFEQTDPSSTIDNISLRWKKAAHNGKYHIYKMNTQGNWVKIHEVIANDAELTVPLSDTSLESDTLPAINEEGLPIYHHFKVDVENSVGMLNTESTICTIPNK